MESLPTAECGQLFCRLGCVCDSLENAPNQTNVSLEHCSRAECMLQYICGYQKRNPSIHISSLYGNHERRVDERLSEDHLHVSPRRRQASGTSSNSSRLSLNPPAKTLLSEPESQQVEHQQSHEQPVEPEVPDSPKVIEEQHKEESTPRPAVDTAEIANAIQQKRKEVEEILGKIKQKVNRMKSDTNKLSKNQQKTAPRPVPWKRPVVSPSSNRSVERLDKIFSLLISIRDRDSSPLGEQPNSTLSSQDEQPKEESNRNLPDLVSPSANWSAERLDKMFSRLRQNSGDLGPVLFSNFGDSSARGTSPST